MSLDISSFLKNEISKKAEELQNAAKPKSSNGAQNEQDDLIEAQNNDNSNEDEQESSPSSEVTIKDQLERLKTRSDRIERSIESESSIPTEINPIDVGNTDKTKYIALQCNIYIHSIIQKWEEFKTEYQEQLLLDTKKSLFPLLVQLRKGTLPHDLTVSLATVLYHLQQPKEINLAIESYMKLSIGNVAWPIGVTSIGIHARSANAKIQGENGQIANIMQDDKTRLWITSIKRLITFKEWLVKHST